MSSSTALGRGGHDDAVHELMDRLLNPAAEEIWDRAGYVITAEGETELWPTTDAGWRKVALAAEHIAALAEVLATKEFAPSTHGNPAADWVRFSSNLRAVALQARDIALAQDKPGLFDVGGQIYQACVACHNIYMLGETR